MKNSVGMLKTWLKKKLKIRRMRLIRIKAFKKKVKIV